MKLDRWKGMRTYLQELQKPVHSVARPDGQKAGALEGPGSDH